MSAARLVDAALDRSVVLGFTKVGLAVRRRLPGWPADAEPDSLAGRDVAVTGASSGLGTATALGLARLGANVHLVVRNEQKAKPVVARIESEVPTAVVRVHRCDLADLDDVRRFAADFDAQLTTGDLHALVHNAGAMPAERTESPQGHEMTMAVHVLGPVLMSELVPADRVVLVTSGGMYGQRLRPDDPEYLDGDYSPTTAYARSKRAQVELLAVLDARWAGAVWATHPGWADTRGVATSLPTFRTLTRPLLRDVEAGADTTVWLAATDPAPASGGLWHDRRQRPTHLLPTTRSRQGDVQRMWRWVREQTGIEEVVG